MYKVEDPLSRRCFLNANEALLDTIGPLFYDRVYPSQEFKVFKENWKDIYNVEMVFLDDIVVDIAVFESEEDFICFKLKWS